MSGHEARVEEPRGGFVVLSREALARVAGRPRLTLALYLLGATASLALGRLATLVSIEGALAGRPAPEALDWAALSRLHHPQLPTLGIVLASAALAWALVGGPLMAAGALGRLHGGYTFIGALRRFGWRLVALAWCSALAFGALGFIAVYGLAEGYALASSKAHEAWTLALVGGPAALVVGAALALAALQQQARAALMDTPATHTPDLGLALGRAFWLLKARWGTVTMLVVTCSAPRLALGLGALYCAIWYPGQSGAQVLAQLATFGRLVVLLTWSYAASIELEKLDKTSNT